MTPEELSEKLSILQRKMNPVNFAEWILKNCTITELPHNLYVYEYNRENYLPNELSDIYMKL